MRIAYLVWYDVQTNSGVWRKVLAQAAAWQRLGHQPFLLALGAHGDECESSVPATLSCEFFAAGSWRQRFGQVQRIMERVAELNADVLYFRLAAFYPPMERTFASRPAVVEINTDDLAEYQQQMSAAKFWYYQHRRRRLFRFAAGFASVSQELADRLCPTDRPHIVVPNAIEQWPVASVQQLRKRDRASLLFVGSPQYYWNGIDKVLDLATHLPACDFHIVGYQTTDLGAVVPPNVTCHGVLSVNEYQHLLQQADIGLGTLALHRKGMNEASPLKVREYLSHGLPTIIAYQDTDFAQPVNFLLQLPNTEDNVRCHYDQIRQFVHRWQGTRFDTSLVQQLDIVARESARLAFMQSLVDSKSNGTCSNFASCRT